jgi:hypothetical protein
MSGGGEDPWSQEYFDNFFILKIEATLLEQQSVPVKNVRQSSDTSYSASFDWQMLHKVFLGPASLLDPGEVVAKTSGAQRVFHSSHFSGDVT